MGRHLWVNPERLKHPRKESSVGGYNIYVEQSPYDMPKGITGSYNDKTGLFVIQFKYIDDEQNSKSAYRSPEGIEFFEGQKSGRLLSITVPVDAEPHDSIAVIALQTKVRNALHNRKEKIPSEYRKLNQLDTVEEILDQSNLEMLAGVA